MSDRLFELYRKLAAQNQAPDAEALARLGAGENLGAEHDAVLLQAAASAAASDALAIALVTSDNAAALARSLTVREARTVVRREAPMAAPSRDLAGSYRRALPMPWLTAAAAIAVGFTLMLDVGAPVQPAPQQVVSDAAPSPRDPAPDSLMQGSFEPASIVAADSFESETPPELFSDDFDA